MQNAPTRREVSYLVERYIAMLSGAYRSRAWMNCRSHLARLIINVEQLDFEHLRDAARELSQDTTLSKSYRRDVVSTWRRFLAWCCEELVIESATVDRFAYMRLRYPLCTPSRCAPIPCFSGDTSATATRRRGRPAGATSRTAPDPRRDPEGFFFEVRKALPFFAPDLRDVVRLLLLTGARPCELLGLTTFAIDTASLPWVAVLDDHKTADRTGEPRYIVFNAAARSILDRRIKPFCPHDFLFPAPKNINKPIDTGLVQKRLRRSLTREKLKTWTLYDARRWAATVARGSEGLEAAQALLGHSRASTTEIYAPPQLSDAIRAARALDRRVQP